MAQKGSIDPEERIGPLFWLVGRTSKDKEANMELQHVSFESLYKVVLPSSKKRKASQVHREPHDMRSLPVMVNKKAINNNTQFLVPA